MTADQGREQRLKAISKEEAIDLAKQFVPFVKKIWPYSAVYLFGSYAKGCQRDDSDIDIAVILPDYGTLTAGELFKARGRLWLDADSIDDRIEPCVRTMHDGSGFVRTVLETGIRVDTD